MAGLAELFTIICGTDVLLAYQSRCDFGHRKLSKPHMPNGVCQDLALSGRACQANDGLKVDSHGSFAGEECDAG